MSGSDARHDPIREEALDWLLRVEDAPNDETLHAGLAAWRARSDAHEAAYRSVARVWRLAEELPRDHTQDAAAARPRARRGVVRFAVAASVVAALAACLLMIFAPGLWLRLDADYATDTGEVREVALDDGSRIHLDAESAVAVDYGPGQRSVRLLAGRAFFEVTAAPERPFVVETEGLRVTVTGTAFAVGTAPDSESVAVQSGSVAVSAGGAGAPEARLQGGDRLTLSHAAGSVRRGRVAPGDVASWRGGRLVVDGMPLAELVEEIDRHQRGVIWLRDPALGRRPVTGVFDLSNPRAALEAAAAAQRAQVTALTPYLLIVDGR